MLRFPDRGKQQVSFRADSVLPAPWASPTLGVFEQQPVGKRAVSRNSPLGRGPVIAKEEFDERTEKSSCRFATAQGNRHAVIGHTCRRTKTAELQQNFSEIPSTFFFFCEGNINESSRLRKLSRVPWCLVARAKQGFQHNISLTLFVFRIIMGNIFVRFAGTRVLPPFCCSHDAGYVIGVTFSFSAATILEAGRDPIGRAPHT